MTRGAVKGRRYELHYTAVMTDGEGVVCIVPLPNRSEHSMDMASMLVDLLFDGLPKNSVEYRLVAVDGNENESQFEVSIRGTEGGDGGLPAGDVGARIKRMSRRLKRG